MSVLALLDEDDDSGFELLATAEKPKPKFDVSSALSGATAGALGLADAVAGFGRDLVDIDAKGPDRFRRRLYEQRAQSPDPEVAQEAQAYLQRAEEYVAEIKEGRLQRALERERIYAPEPGNVLNDVLFGVGKFLPAIGATAVNPAVGAGVLAGTAEAEGRLTEAQLRESGVNADAAAQAGTVTRVSTFAGGLLPGALPVVSGARLAVGLNGITARSLGTRMALRASTGGAINAGAGIGERLATSAILEHAGFAEQAKAYRWNDAMSLSVDAILGAAFGSIDSPASDPGITERALRDADYLHATKTTAPGIVASQRGAADHDAALRLAAETLDETGRVDVSSVYSDDDLFSPVVLQADDAADIDASDRVAEPEPRFLTRDQQMEGSIDALVSEITGLENDFIAEQKKLGLSLASFVVKKRGIRDDGGDVRSFMGEARTRPGLINSKGTPIDIMARAAQEAGWFTGVSREDLVQRFMEALEADVRGEKQYSDLDRAVTANVIELKQAIHFWNSNGVDSTAQGEELRQQVRDFLRAEQAQEQAQLDEAVQMPGFVDDVELAEYERLRAEASIVDKPQETIVVFDPANIRSIHAAFDPSFSDSPSLLASGARNAGIAGSVDALRSSASRAFGVRPSVIDRLMQSGRVTVVADDAEARARLGATNEELPDGQGGVYRASTGEVVIVAANVEPETAHRVLLHEVGVHAGMRGLLGEKRFVELLSSVQAMLPEAVRTGKEFASLVDLVRAFGRDREALRPVLDQIGGVNEDVLLSFAEAEAFALQPEHRAEEALAYLVENAPDLPLVQRLLASIRQWLWRAFGSEFGPSLNVSDLQMMAVAALQTAFDPQSGNSPGLLASFARVRTPEGRAELLRDITVAQGDDGSSAYGWRVGETAIAMVVRPKGVDGRFSVNFGALRQGGLSFARVGASSLEQTERILENVLAALRYDMQTRQRPRYEFFGADPQLAALYERILKRFGAPEGYAIEPDKTGVIRFVRTGEVVGAPDAEPVKISGGLRVLEALEAKIAPDAQPLSAQDAPRIRRIERVRGAAYDDLRSAFSGDVNPVVRAAADIVRSDPELRLETESGAINASDLVDAVSAQHRAAQEVAPVFGEAAQCAIANGGFEAAATTAAQPGASLLGAQALRIASIAGLSAGTVQLLQMDEAA